jgi:hypothetical protein
VQHDDIRSVTREEVDHFRERGWVKLDQLLAPGLVDRLRERAEVLVAGADDDHPLGSWVDVYDPVQRDESFEQVGFSQVMGLNAQRLMKRSVGVLLYSNLLAVKMGAGSTFKQSIETRWHQDGTDTPIDRSSWVRFWVALNHVPPEKGSMRFIDRGHRIGPIGNDHMFREDGDKVLLERYPEMEELGVAGPVDLQPGDATVHSMFTIHGAGINQTTDPRFGFILTYFSDDTRYTASSDSTALLAKAEAAGLKRGDCFAGPSYPRVSDALPLWD